ncbi:MAG: hypothetical protein JSV61_13245 [Anaerolineales bacterium]|nr:MAG: hypothetical protein JSV61_13245 [Anaerolineales bacterium]
MTAQIHERLIINGHEKTMMTCPWLPEGHPRLIEVDIYHRENVAVESFLFTTACWRRYQGTWEIREGKFYLIGLRGRFQLQGEDPLFADWYSGMLRIPRGEILQYVHMGFESVFAEEVYVDIANGEVVSMRLVENRGKPHDEWGKWWNFPPVDEIHFLGDFEL